MSYVNDGPCSVYVVGHPHKTFGHAVKVGVATHVRSRLSALQTANAEKLECFYSFRFPTRAAAFEVERVFHKSEILSAVRGEWIKGQPIEAIYLLAVIGARILRRRFPASEIPTLRRRCGITDALDRFEPYLSDEQQLGLADAIAGAEEGGLL